MASRSPSPKTSPESSSPDGLLSISPSSELPHIPSEQTVSFHGPVAILWDIENCPVPSDVRPEDVAGNIRMALRVHPVIKGAVTMFSAYGDFNAFPRRLREGCQRTGVKLVDVPNGRKDAADKAILVDMFLFALDNRPPSSILLISGDVDFAPALHILGQRGYTIILVIPAGVGVSSALSNAGRFVWDWPSVARGEGFVHPKIYMSCGPEMGGYLMSCNYGDNSDSQNDEEAIVYRGTSQSEYNSRAEIKQICCYNSSHTSREFSKASHFVSEYSGNSFVPGPHVSSSRSQSLPSSYSEAPIGNQNSAQGWWVQPGDVQGLKGQLVRLLEMAGGSLPLVRVPPEYLKTFGRPLYMSEYGVYKLVNLIKKMEDTFVVVGKGNKKLLCLRKSSDKNIRKCPSTPIILRRDKKGKGVTEENVDIGICANMGSSSDDSEDERIAGFDERLLSFRQEVQELLVCCCWVVPLDEFKSLYEQRYKKSLDYHNFGVTELEELIEKLRDVVVLREDLGSNKKLLFSSCVSG